MNNQQEKKIEYNPDFWTIGRKTRKNTGRSSEPKKPKPEPVMNATETRFSNELSHLTSLINNSNATNPSWGNLKNGNLPTYRAYHSTANNGANPTQQQPISSPNQAALIALQSAQQPPTEPKYYLGRNKKKRTTKIRILGKKSRRKIKKYMRDLEQQSLTEIKNDLYNNCLIKCGGDTPADVLKEMYKVSKLTGGIKNKNGEIMLHNFYSNENTDDDGGT